MLAEYTKASKKAKKKSGYKTTEPSKTPQPKTLAIGPTDYREPEVSTNIIQDNAIAYVAGYLFEEEFQNLQVPKMSGCSFVQPIG